MFDDLAGDSGFEVGSVNQSSAAPSHQGGGGYQSQQPAPGGQQNSSGYDSGYGGGNNNNGGGNGYQQQQRPANGGYQQRQGGGGGGFQRSGGGGFQRKEEVLEDPYLPVLMYVEKDYPMEIKQKFYQLASKLIGKGYTVRINADDTEFVQRVQQLSSKKVELYLPFKNFNQLESKHTWNTLTSKALAQQHFAAYDKIPDVVKSILAAQVRMLFGDRNNSIALMVLTYSPDGASRIAELTKDTGRAGFLIKMACSYTFSVANLGKQSSESLVEKYFNL